jgi:hypothetical protein
MPIGIGWATTLCFVTSPCYRDLILGLLRLAYLLCYATRLIRLAYHLTYRDRIQTHCLDPTFSARMIGYARIDLKSF